jgi:serine/threonine protein kinase
MSDLEIFTNALEKSIGEPREAYLTEVCGADVAQRQRVEDLLKRHEHVGDFLERPATNIPSTLHVKAFEPESINLIGSEIAGRYKILEHLGEGGMGSVYVATQMEPVRRKVAIKIIKLGMESTQILSRFDSERQVLALMDHPNIARIYDGGLTVERRPYFVMELVNGLSLISFCDQTRLGIKDRLELFAQVCQAVQHAHQKGIVHRDLKPSNILVTMIDGKPVPKVIDFGIAKAIGDNLADGSMITQFGAVVGTLEYMSPEQASFSNVDVDTRADIYSLGVILYELLTGLKPFDSKRFQHAALDEMMRIIREDEPRRPSTRLSTAESLPAIAAYRHIEPKRLTALLRGDLDWVVMKCLEKNRERRYESASSLVKDIQNYLNHQPVQASPPSSVYRLKKWVRRNPIAIAVSITALVTILGGIVATEIERNRRLEETQLKLQAYEKLQEEQIKTKQALAKEQLAREEEAKLRRIAEEQMKRAEKAEADTLADYKASTDDTILLLLASKAELGKQEKEYLEKSLNRWSEFARRKGDDPHCMAIRAEGLQRVAYLRARLGQVQDSLKEHREALVIFQKLHETDTENLGYRERIALTHSRIGNALSSLGKYTESQQALESAKNIYESLLKCSPVNREYQWKLAYSLKHFANSLFQSRQFEQALKNYQRSHDLFESLAKIQPQVRDYHAMKAGTLGSIALTQSKLGNRIEARLSFVKALESQRKLVEQYPDWYDEHSSLANIHNSYAGLLSQLGEHDSSRVEYEAARNIYQKLADQFPSFANYLSGLAGAHYNLGNHHCERGQREQAKVAYESAIRVWNRLAARYPSQPLFRRELAKSQFVYGDLLLLDSPAKAQEVFGQAIVQYRQLVQENSGNIVDQLSLSSASNNLARIHKNLGQLNDAIKEFEQAAELLQRLHERHPQDLFCCEQRANVLNDLGLVYSEVKQSERALQCIEQSWKLRKQLSEAEPKTLKYQILLGSSCTNMGMVVSNTGKSALAKEWYSKAITTLEQARKLDPQSALCKQSLKSAYIGRWAILITERQMREAEQDWNQAWELVPLAERQRLKAARVLTIALAGLVEEAVAETMELTKTTSWSAEQWVDFASVYAIARSKKADKPEYQLRAMELLQKAVHAGYKNGKQLMEKQELVSLRDREDFKKLVNSLNK